MYTNYNIDTTRVKVKSLDYSECIMIYNTIKTLNDLGCFKLFSLKKVKKTKFYGMEILRRDSRKNDHKPSSVIYDIKVKIVSKQSINEEYYSLIAKVSKNYLYFVSNTVKNEQLFYQVLAPCIKGNYIPNSFVHENVPFDPPVLILENLKTMGYKVKRDTLDKHHLRICIKYLAWFHVEMMKLSLKQNELIKEFYNNLFGRRRREAKQKRVMQKLWTIIETKILDSNLIEKVKKKTLDFDVTVGFWDTKAFSIIIHGYFIRSNILFRYTIRNLQKPCYIKIVGWQAITCGSPSIDFGSILITNLPKEITVSNLETFYQDMLTFYLDQVIAKNSRINREALKQEIIDNLFLSYINYYVDIETPGHTNFHEILLETFNKLGSLN